MWKKFDMDFKFECDMDCGLVAPPPEFNIPPPPLPPFLKELTHCSEGSSTDFEMCSLISFTDLSYDNSSLQTSAMALLCSVLLLIFISISSILVWKHKRKHQNNLPYKTSSTSESPTDPSILFNGYENPDAFTLRYQKTLERHHHFNMLQPKTVHYPSGFPMPQTPPVFICSSPGPDPYESNDNLYEELDQPDTQSEASQHDRSLQRSTSNHVSDNLNSSADTASASDEILTMSNNNNNLHDAVHGASDISDNGNVCGRNNYNGNTESEVERRNRINAQLSNPTLNVATIFRDRNIRYHHPTRANANYYAPPQHMMGIQRTNNYTENNHRSQTNPRRDQCWNNANFRGTYEPIMHGTSLVYNSYFTNSECLAYHTPEFASHSNSNSIRSPHHISQNSVSPRRNLLSWFKQITS